MPMPNKSKKPQPAEVFTRIETLRKTVDAKLGKKAAPMKKQTSEL